MLAQELQQARATIQYHQQQQQQQRPVSHKGTATDATAAVATSQQLSHGQDAVIGSDHKQQPQPATGHDADCSLSGHITTAREPAGMSRYVITPLLLCSQMPHHTQNAVELLLTAVEAIRLLVIHAYAEQQNQVSNRPCLAAMSRIWQL